MNKNICPYQTHTKEMQALFNKYICIENSLGYVPAQIFIWFRSWYG